MDRQVKRMMRAQIIMVAYFKDVPGLPEISLYRIMLS